MDLENIIDVLATLLTDNPKVSPDYVGSLLEQLRKLGWDYKQLKEDNNDNEKKFKIMKLQRDLANTWCDRLQKRNGRLMNDHEKMYQLLKLIQDNYLNIDEFNKYDYDDFYYYYDDEGNGPFLRDWVKLPDNQ